MRRATTAHWVPWIMMLSVLMTSGGCVGFWANLIYGIRGENIPPEYPGFKGKKVAIICSGDKGLSNDATSTLLTHYMQMLLTKNVKDITIIPQERVDKWLSERGWEEPDYETIGKGVGADQILAISLTNLSLRDGKTLYKGKSDISVTVYDVARGGVVFRKEYPEEVYPKLDGPSIVDTTESKFRTLYLQIVSQKIGVLFYPHNPNDLAVLDPLALSR